VWQAEALHPAAGVVIMGASPLALRKRTPALDQVKVLGLLAATLQKFPLLAEQATYIPSLALTPTSTLESAAKVTAR
jgi:hypothetical protein